MVSIYTNCKKQKIAQKIAHTLLSPGSELLCVGLQLDQALKLAHRGAAVISRHAPAFRAGDSQLAYTRQAVVELMREVSVVCGSGLNSMVVLNQ